MSDRTADSDQQFPLVLADAIGWLTEEQMVEVDRVMIEDLRIDLIQMMENAGRNLANLAIARHHPERATVLAGSGGNGGGGLVAARHLANRGIDVTVTLTRPDGDLHGVPGHQLEILNRIGVPVADAPLQADLVIDAVIGYSLRGAPTGRAAELINWANDQAAPVVSLDTPSGLDVTTGKTPGVVIAADATMTLALPKGGLRAAEPVGALYLADISVPPSVYRALGVQSTDPFLDGPVVLVTGR